MTSGVIVGPATGPDIPVLVGLLSQLFAIETGFTIDPTIQERGLTALLGRPDAVILAARQDDRVIGMATVQLTVSTARGGFSAGVEDVVVDASVRGLGVGRSLLDAAEAWARARGAVRIALLADETNAPALDFYDRLGFTRTRLVWLARTLD